MPAPASCPPGRRAAAASSPNPSCPCPLVLARSVPSANDQRALEEAMARWGIIADDLTGACAVAAMFAERGASAWVALGPAPPRRPPTGTDVVVVDTATRDATRAQAAPAATAAQRWLIAAGTRRIA